MLQIFTRNGTAQKHKNFGFLKTDMHSHLIPGIDDGASSKEDSLQLLKGLAEMGYEKIITTPHVRPDYFPNRESDIRQRFAELEKEVRAANIKLKLECAAEYYIDHTFGDKIESGEMLTFSNRHVLIELSTLAPPPNFEENVFRLKLKGYRPVLAHPERYVYYKGIEHFIKFRELGCLLQLNLLSLTGHYGKKVKELAQKLIKSNLIDLLGTDMHHQRHLESLQKMASNRSMMKMISQHQYMNASL